MQKIFVGNIPHASSDTDLQQWVESQGFHVESAQIIRDRSTGMSRGFGFVILNEEWKIKEAIAALNGQRMGGRVLTVNEAVPMSPRSDGAQSGSRNFRSKRNSGPNN
jgi:RNA recognition motif-containing protein